MTSDLFNDGGPAFPVVCDAKAGDVALGMSLRDWFAGHALAGLLAAPDGPLDATLYAVDAYAAADAMLKERDK